MATINVTITPAMVHDVLVGFSASELAEAFAGLEDRLRPLLASATEDEEPVGRGRPLKDSPVFPVGGVGGTPPTAADYRLPAGSVLAGTCVARLVHADDRWSPRVYLETQCCSPVVAGSDICSECAVRSDKFHYNGGAPKANGYSWNWHGRITEEPPAWLHMLGTAWGVTRLAQDKLRWYPDGVEVARVEAAAAKAAEKAAREESALLRAAEKAEAAFKKAVAKAEAKAAKEAAKAVAKAEAMAAKEAAKAAKRMGGGAAAGAASGTSGTIEPIDDELYWREGNNLWQYDLLEQRKGKWVGVLQADGETIDIAAKPPKRKA
jgi:hypothetical protein